MNFMIYGNDCRHALLSAMLTRAGWSEQAPADLLILSPKEHFTSHTDVVKENAMIWGGPASDMELLTKAGYRKITQSAAFRTKNSVYTAEGALALAISESPVALCESRVLVLGYGFLGKECSRLFAALDADVTVYSKAPAELALAERDGFTALPLERLATLDGTLILNTIPFPVLDTLPVSAKDAPALLIELASTPCCTQEIPGVRIVPGGALPSRFSPDSAAKLMFEEIETHFGKE